MALTITYNNSNDAEILSHNYSIISGSIAFDSSYPTGGEAFDLSGKFATLTMVLIEPNSGYVFTYDYTNKKVIAYWVDNDGSADSAMIQVANTTDLSGITAARFVAFGLRHA